MRPHEPVGTPRARENQGFARCPLADGGPCPFPEEHLSGALDGALTRVELARVRRRVETCAHCGRLYAELQLNREAARTTRFPAPPDEQWNEMPRGMTSHLARNVGLGLFAALALVLTGLFLVQPRLLEQEVVVLWLVRAVVVALLAVLVSAGIDRWRSAKGDLYRGVKR